MDGPRWRRVPACRAGGSGGESPGGRGYRISGPGVPGRSRSLPRACPVWLISSAVFRWWTDRSDDLHTHLDRAFTDLRLAANALK